MKTFKHAGTLGDLIFSLPVVKKLGGGIFRVSIDDLARTVNQYRHPGIPEIIDTAHRGRFSTRDFELLAPLLERQSYITGTSTWHEGDAGVDVDLDRFRSVLWRTFEGNYVEAYHRTFDLPFTPETLEETWLEADATTVAPIVVTRTPRYRHPEPMGWAQYKQMATDAQLDKNGIFVGIASEHEEFVRETGVAIPLHPVNDFLELANVIAGADLVLTNQSFVFSIAMGLGKAAVCETFKIKPLHMSECYFPRSNVQYW